MKDIGQRKAELQGYNGNGESYGSEAMETAEEALEIINDVQRQLTFAEEKAASLRETDKEACGYMVKQQEEIKKLKHDAEYGKSMTVSARVEIRGLQEKLEIAIKTLTEVDNALSRETIACSSFAKGITAEALNQLKENNES